MINEELVCTPDLVVPHFQLNDSSQFSSGKDIQVGESICLVPPILTDVQEACSVVAENFRKIAQTVVDHLVETRLNIIKIMEKVDSVSVESYQKQFQDILCEINQSICKMNIAKHKLMTDRVNLMGQTKAPITATTFTNTATKKSPKTSRIVIKMPKKQSTVESHDAATKTTAIKVTNACTANTVVAPSVSTGTSDATSNLSALLPIFHSIPTISAFLNPSDNSDFTKCSTPNSAIDDQIAAKKEMMRIKRREKSLQRRLMKRIRPCSVKLIRQDLNKLKEELIKQYGPFLKSNGNIVKDESMDEDQNANVDTNADADANSAAVVVDTHNETENSLISLNGCLVTYQNDNCSSLKNSILVTNSLNACKSQKSVSFALDVIDKSSS